MVCFHFIIANVTFFFFYFLTTEYYLYWKSVPHIKGLICLNVCIVLHLNSLLSLKAFLLTVIWIVSLSSKGHGDKRTVVQSTSMLNVTCVYLYSPEGRSWATMQKALLPIASVDPCKAKCITVSICVQRAVIR